jgi:hypothetical protein
VLKICNHSSIDARVWQISEVGFTGGENVLQAWRTVDYLQVMPLRVYLESDY